VLLCNLAGIWILDCFLATDWSLETEESGFMRVSLQLTGVWLKGLT